MKILTLLLALALPLGAAVTPSDNSSPPEYPMPTAEMFPPRPGKGDERRLVQARLYFILIGHDYPKYFWSRVGLWTVGKALHPIYYDMAPPLIPEQAVPLDPPMEKSVSSAQVEPAAPTKAPPPKVTYRKGRNRWEP